LDPSILHLESESEQFKIKHEKVPHYGLDIDEHIYVSGKLMSIGVDGQES